MTNFEQSLIEKIEYLIALEVGDISRLKSIEKRIIENKKLYNSDISYVEELVQKNPSRLTERFGENYFSVADNKCWKCSEAITVSSNFCSFCGAKQNKKISNFNEPLSNVDQKEHSGTIISAFYSYQFLALIGGLAALIPILISVANLERIFEIIEFYTGRDFSSFYFAFIALGVVSGILCLLAIVIPIRLKKPNKVGKFLIYLSFGILILSLLSGVMGFAIILFAGLLVRRKDLQN
ncbi:MAG: zinc ribbon domain-containing protein [Nitrosopumilus sp.]|nr:zinc ribbon domain-containing protein [Nitrosopumilus sp.]MDH3385004.1 zinc ribbon domain-containing protein [Nitrosopumilus sp.]